jgi:hypothetical protein
MIFHKRRYSLIKRRLIGKIYRVWWDRRHLPWLPLMILLLWVDFFLLFIGFRVGLIFLDRNPYLVDPSDIAISTTDNYHGPPFVAFNGICYLVAWAETHDTVAAIQAVRISPGGDICDPQHLTVSRKVYKWCKSLVASNGKDWFVIWADSTDKTDFDLHGARVSAEGVVLDDPQLDIAVARGDQVGSAVASDGEGYLVAWRDMTEHNHGVYALRVSSSGKIRDKSPIGITKSKYVNSPVAVASDGENYLLVWTELRSNNSQVVAVRVGSQQKGLGLNTILISKTSACEYFLPHVAYGRDKYLVVWEVDCKGRSMPSLVLGRMISKSGDVINDTDIVVSERLQRLGYGAPRTAFGKSDFLVVWFDNLGIGRRRRRDIYGARVSVNGIVLDTVNIPITSIRNTQAVPDVAFDGMNYFVVWWDARTRPMGHIFGTRVSTEGILIDKKKMPSFDELRQRRKEDR